jgi:hypothetical protein
LLVHAPILVSGRSPQHYNKPILLRERPCKAGSYWYFMLDCMAYRTRMNGSGSQESTTFGLTVARSTLTELTFPFPNNA